MGANYWEDARFLLASADVVDGYEAEIAQSNEIATEIEAALAQEQRLHEESLHDSREAVALGWDMASPNGHGFRPPYAGTATDIMEAVPDANTFITSSPSLYLERVPSP